METAGHLLSACDRHKFSLYKQRHDEAILPVVSELCTPYGIPPPKLRKKPPPVLENNRMKLLWDPLMVTTVDMRERRPDLVVFLKREKQIVVVEQTCPWDGRLGEAYREKWQKYQALVADLKTQYPEWNVRQCTLVMGVLGSFRKEGMDKELENLCFTDRKRTDRVIANCH